MRSSCAILALVVACAAPSGTALPLDAEGPADVRIDAPPVQARVWRSEATLSMPIGYPVAVAVDGDIAVLGDVLWSTPYDSGEARLLIQSNGVWSSGPFLLPSDPQDYDSYGAVVAISGDTIAVGAPSCDLVPSRPGHVDIFSRSGIRLTTLRATTQFDHDCFGASIALVGNNLAIASSDGVHLFH